MDLFDKYLTKQIEVKISDTIRHTGYLVDLGTDILVLYNGKDYIYISNMHIQKVKEYPDEGIQPFSEEEYHVINNLSIRKVLTNLKWNFTEISIGDSESESVHGYVTNVLNDYFVFYSPVYKTTFIPFKKLKWFIPYHGYQTPYALDKFPIKPSDLTLARTFDVQLQKLMGQIIILDLGLSTDKIGQLKGIFENYMELATARGESVYLNLNHIKSVHFQ